MFPAGAGMNRTLVMVTLYDAHVPRWRGDEPDLTSYLNGLDPCSPLARG